LIIFVKQRTYLITLANRSLYQRGNFTRRGDIVRLVRLVRTFSAHEEEMSAAQFRAPTLSCHFRLSAHSSQLNFDGHGAIRDVRPGSPGLLGLDFGVSLRMTFLEGTSLVGPVSNWISELGINVRNELQNVGESFMVFTKGNLF
jgi:hypothetical protein